MSNESEKPEPKRKSLSCVYEGSPAPPPNGKPSSKQYYECEKGYGVVCRCQCSPSKCKDYTPDDSTVENSQ